MTMLTTKQVRDIMRANGGYPMYTNKTTGHTGNIRRVKAHYNGNKKMLNALRKAAGVKNVTLTSGPVYGYYNGEPSVTVKCTLG